MVQHFTSSWLNYTSLWFKWSAKFWNKFTSSDVGNLSALCSVEMLNHFFTEWYRTEIFYFNWNRNDKRNTKYYGSKPCNDLWNFALDFTSRVNLRAYHLEIQTITHSSESLSRPSFWKEHRNCFPTFHSNWTDSESVVKPWRNRSTLEKDLSRNPRRS